jgi:hypothetical protein
LIANGYDTVIITTNAGKQFTGVFKGETGDAVNLMDAEGKASPPPGLSRWSARFCTIPLIAATGLALVLSSFLHYVVEASFRRSCSAKTNAPPGQARWRQFLARSACSAETSAPPGQARWRRLLARSVCSAETNAPPGQARWRRFLPVVMRFNAILVISALVRRPRHNRCSSSGTVTKTEQECGERRHRFLLGANIDRHLSLHVARIDIECELHTAGRFHGRQHTSQQSMQRSRVRRLQLKVIPIVSL